MVCNFQYIAMLLINYIVHSYVRPNGLLKRSGRELKFKNHASKKKHFLLYKMLYTQHMLLIFKTNLTADIYILHIYILYFPHTFLMAAFILYTVYFPQRIHYKGNAIRPQFNT